MNRKMSAGDSPDLHWFKSSYSDSSNPSDCVEIAISPAAVHVRDSKRSAGPRLTVAPGTWARFVAHTERSILL
jgi:hypothetical protein